VSFIYAQTGDLFQVKKSISEDITGNITTSEMEIYNSGVSEDVSTSVYLLKMKAFPDGTSVKQFSVLYVGQSWNFFETIQIKIDDDLFNFRVENPQRVTQRSFVVEILNVELSKEIIDKLYLCKNLIVQVNGKYRGRPITIDTNGMRAINNFFTTTG
jgi:hypothetical protein